MGINHHESLKDLEQIVKNVPEAQRAAVLKQLMIANSIEPLTLGSNGVGSEGSELESFVDNVFLGTKNGTVEIDKIATDEFSLATEITITSTNGKPPNSNEYNSSSVNVTLPALLCKYNYLYNNEGKLYMHQGGDYNGEAALYSRRYELPGITSYYGVQVGSKVYIGGDAIIVRDLETNSMLEEDQLPTPYEMYRTGIIVHDGWVYFIGQADTGKSKYFRRVNIKTKEIEVLTNLPIALDGSGGIGIGDDIYILGGRTVYNTYKYNITTGLFTKLASMPYYGYNVHGFHKDGYIYCVSPTYSSMSVYLMRYDIANNTWTSTKLLHNSFIGGIFGEYLYYMKTSEGTFKVNMITGYTSKISTYCSSYGTYDERGIHPYKNKIYMFGDNYTKGHMVECNIMDGVYELDEPVEHELGIDATIKSYSPITKVYIDGMNSIIDIK